MTRITFERSGDQATSFGFDLDSLPANEAQNLLRLIGDANFFNLPRELVKSPAPDDPEYTITVEAGQARHTVHTSDTTVSDALRPLLDELSMLVVNSEQNK